MEKNPTSFYDDIWRSAQATSKEEKMLLSRRDAVEYSYQLLGDVNQKKVLEIGGGSGQQALFFAARGAKVTVIDLSEESLKSTSHMAREKGISLSVHQMNAQEMTFKADQFDRIYINSVLMHVDQQKVLQECSRVLRKGGKLIVVEPLQHAPFVQIYRLLSLYRNIKPKYATLKMFKEGKKYFSEYQHREFYLFSSALLPLFYVKNEYLHKMYHFFARGDTALIKLFPFLRYACWVSVVGYRK